MLDKMKALVREEGLFIHTFANRWFPPKAIKIWKELSEFERMGLVSKYFLESGSYDNVKTYSARGGPALIRIAIIQDF